METFKRGNDLVIRAELPGVQQKDVKVELTDEGLLIQGEHKRDFEDEGEGYYRSERSYGRFHRLVPLPALREGVGTVADVQAWGYDLRLAARRNLRGGPFGPAAGVRGAVMQIQGPEPPPGVNWAALRAEVAATGTDTSAVDRFVPPVTGSAGFTGRETQRGPDFVAPR